MIGGAVLLVAYVIIERTVQEPMFHLRLFAIRAFTAGNVAGLASSIARGGMQFVLIIWLQGVWLPLHGYDFDRTPLWAGIFMLPLSVGFLIAGPIAGMVSDRFGSRGIGTSGMVLFALTFLGLAALPIDFPYWLFALLILLNGIASGMFTAPNTASIMGAVPSSYRGVASGMRSTFQNTGTALSIGVFMSLLTAGLAAKLPHTLTSGLIAHGVAADTAQQVGSLPPVSSLFATMLGVNPIQHLLGPTGALDRVSDAQRAALTGHTFFPQLIAGPFHTGLVVVFVTGAVLGLAAAVASLLRGGRAVHLPD
jgi:MFS family permease